MWPSPIESKPNPSIPGNCLMLPSLSPGVCCDHVEGGMYIGPEFQLGQVYDGNFDPGSGGASTGDPVVLYRPVYVCVPSAKLHSIQTPKNRHLLKLDAHNLRKGSDVGREHTRRDQSNSPVARGSIAGIAPGKGPTGNGSGGQNKNSGSDKVSTSTMWWSCSFF